jgi:glutaredoxin
VKKLLQEKKILHTIIDCDEYLVEEKEAFLKQVETWVGKEWKLFPMVFLDGSFVGGFKETKEHVEKMLTSFEENIVF